MKKLKRFLIDKINGYHLPHLVKAKNWDIKPEDKICILAPHADDEAIGCGGLLAKYGKQCDVILLTDGATSAQSKHIQLMREKEFSRVMEFYGVNAYHFMRAADTCLIEAYDLFEKLDFTPYSYVLMPHPLDAHKDHIVPSAFFKRLKKEKKIKAKAVYYEVWGVMAEPTHYIDITAEVEKKRAAIDMYASQRNIDYAERILALNYYRGMHYNINYAEVYTLDN